MQAISLPDVDGSICVAVSGDGHFAYAATGATAREVPIFKRDLDTGRLELVGAAKQPEIICPMRLRFAAAEKYLVVADARTNSAPIFQRNTTTGLLTKLTDIPADVVKKAGLANVNDAHSSPDNRFVYTSGANGLAVYRWENDNFSFVQVLSGDQDLLGMRPFALSPDGRTLYGVASGPSVLSVFHRDQDSGKLAAIQTLRDGADGIDSLRGCYRLDVSGDGKNVYVCAGRGENGDRAITVFTVQPDGTLKFLQKLVNGTDDFAEFEGGNEIRVSPDGKAVCAVASQSDRLFYFHRDPATGKLTFVASAQSGDFKSPGAAGVCFSPDSKFAYVADEAEGIIAVFKLPHPRLAGLHRTPNTQQSSSSSSS
ncbi:MAG TPA: beta-propeller fold lactonase family protein [Chthoniobacteraceae bacterium]